NNNAMIFNNGSFLYNSLSPQLNMGAQPFTIETSLKLSSYNDQGILSNNYTFVSGSDTLNKGYSLTIKEGKLRFLLSEGISTLFGVVDARSLPISGFVPLDTWVHLVAERTSLGGVKIYINGNDIPITYAVDFPFFGNINNTTSNGMYIGAASIDDTIYTL